MSGSNTMLPPACLSNPAPAYTLSQALKAVLSNVTFAVPNRPEVVYTQIMPEEKLNWLHLN